MRNKVRIEVLRDILDKELKEIEWLVEMKDQWGVARKELIIEIYNKLKLWRKKEQE